MTSALLHSSPQHYYITHSLPDIIRTTLIYFLLLRDDSQVFTIIPTYLFHHHYLSQEAIHLAASTTSYYYAIMPSAPHAMVDNVNHKQYFSQVSTAPHCRNGFPYSSPLLAVAAPWVRIALY